MYCEHKRKRKSRLNVSEKYPYLVSDNVAGNDRADNAWQCSESVTEAHEDAGMSRGDIEVVDAEATPGECTQTNGNRETGDYPGSWGDERHTQHEDRLAEEGHAVEQFSHLRQAKKQPVHIIIITLAAIGTIILDIFKHKFNFFKRWSQNHNFVTLYEDFLSHLLASFPPFTIFFFDTIVLKQGKTKWCYSLDQGRPL